MLELRIQCIEQVCLFDLSWGQGQRISRMLSFPDSLMSLHQQWQQAYFHYYRTAKIPVVVADQSSPGSSLRGQKGSSGAIAPSQQVDWHGMLVEAEIRLLREFHRWLRHEDLYDIRKQIVETSQSTDQAAIDLFLSCSPVLARLPWETWEIGAEFGASKRIRITRSSVNVRLEPTSSVVQKKRTRPRILAILGDDTGLNFKTDKEAVRSLEKVADVAFVGWQPGKEISALRAEIGKAIADPQGWDVLFFAGHSNETQLTGGELGIAPNATMRISELEPKLLIAKERGLQFALFNSCNGLSLAESLIDLGLSQVAVMREPIHDRVAHEFLMQFMQALAAHQDVHEALIAACQFLKVEANLTYPSAYLIPSLFRHSQIPLFCIPLPARQRWIKHWIPKRYEAAALAGLVALSLLPPVQDWLLDRRILGQAYYRQAMPSSRLVKPTSPHPPTLLVRIDDESINRGEIEKIQYIDRTYLASLISRLSALDAKIIGLDYVLDRSQGTADSVLADAIREAKNTKFVFATAYGNQTWLTPKPEFINNNWAVLGNIKGVPYYTTLINQNDGSYIPFPYWLVWLYQSLIQRSPVSLEQIEQVKAGKLDPASGGLITSKMEVSWLTRLSYYGLQLWFHPILDYSIPPQQVYTDMPAWKVLQQPDASELANVAQQIVVIAPGGYGEAGVHEPGQDTLRAPLAMKHWYFQQNPADFARQITGGENHAYVMHHLLNRHFIVPIPDTWMVLLAALSGKGTIVLLQNHRQKNWMQPLQLSQLSFRRFIPLLFLAGGTLLYSLLSLQIYVSSAALLVPIVLPVAIYWSYVAPALIRPKF